jgi:predicted nucleic acid-binding protein
LAFVLDSSVALAWLLPDEGSKATDVLADRLEQEPVHVPAIWALEVGNALLMAQRRARIKDEELARFVSALSALPIDVDPAASTSALPAVLAIARELGLTAYDAAYIELAKRLSLPLASLDAKLRQACARADVAVLP